MLALVISLMLLAAFIAGYAVSGWQSHKIIRQLRLQMRIGVRL